MLSIVLTFSSGQSVGGVQTTSVTILDDSSVKNDEVFTVSINSMDPGVMRGISTAWVTIIEDSSDCTLPWIVCSSKSHTQEVRKPNYVCGARLLKFFLTVFTYTYSIAYFFE